MVKNIDVIVKLYDTCPDKEKKAKLQQKIIQDFDKLHESLIPGKLKYRAATLRPSPAFSLASSLWSQRGQRDPLKAPSLGRRSFLGRRLISTPPANSAHRT